MMATNITMRKETQVKYIKVAHFMWCSGGLIYINQLKYRILCGGLMTDKYAFIV